MSLDRMVDYLVNSPPESKVKPFNPYPPGHIVKGSGSDLTLRLLQHHPDRWFFHHELISALGHSKGQVDWALRQLVKSGLVEAIAHQKIQRPPVNKYRVKAT